MNENLKVPILYTLDKFFMSVCHAQTTISFTWDNCDYVISVSWNDESVSEYELTYLGYSADDVTQMEFENFSDFVKTCLAEAVLEDKNFNLIRETAVDANHVKRAVEICEDIIGETETFSSCLVPSVENYSDYYIAILFNTNADGSIEPIIHFDFSDSEFSWSVLFDDSTEIGDMVTCIKNKGIPTLMDDGTSVHENITFDVINKTGNTVATLISSIPLFLEEFESLRD